MRADSKSSEDVKATEEQLHAERFAKESAKKENARFRKSLSALNSQVGKGGGLGRYMFDCLQTIVVGKIVCMDMHAHIGALVVHKHGPTFASL